MKHIYKVLAKILANGLKRMMKWVISNYQNMFVEVRQILDAYLIAKKALESKLRSGIKRTSFKLDIEKAHDHANCRFLSGILQKMSFWEQIDKIKLLEWCISTISLSIIINGTRSGFFQSSGGLRQGNPPLSICLRL